MESGHAPGRIHSRARIHAIRFVTNSHGKRRHCLGREGKRSFRSHSKRSFVPSFPSFLPVSVLPSKRTFPLASPRYFALSFSSLILLPFDPVLTLHRYHPNSQEPIPEPAERKLFSWTRCSSVTGRVSQKTQSFPSIFRSSGK